MADPGSVAHGIPRAPSDLMRYFADLKRQVDQLNASMGSLGSGGDGLAGVVATLVTNLNALTSVVNGLEIPEDWTDATLVNSWAVTSEPVSYRLQPDGDVRMSGRIQSGATGSVALTLDSVHAPAVRQDFVLVTNVAGSFGAASVAPSGDVTIAIPGGATWVSLSSVRFPTS